MIERPVFLDENDDVIDAAQAAASAAATASST